MNTVHYYLALFLSLFLVIPHWKPCLPNLTGMNRNELPTGYYSIFSVNKTVTRTRVDACQPANNNQSIAISVLAFTVL